MNWLTAHGKRRRLGYRGLSGADCTVHLFDGRIVEESVESSAAGGQ